MAVFGVPVLHEDDALRAVRARPSEMRRRWRRSSFPARIGVNTGEVVVGVGEMLATGDAVNVAARLEQAAAPGEVLIGRGDVPRSCASGRGGAGRAARAEGEVGAGAACGCGAASTRPAFARRLDAPLVGRGARAARSGGF